jgi:hypothetical protein
MYLWLEYLEHRRRPCCMPVHSCGCALAQKHVAMSGAPVMSVGQTRSRQIFQIVPVVTCFNIVITMQTRDEHAKTNDEYEQRPVLIRQRYVKR